MSDNEKKARPIPTNDRILELASLSRNISVSIKVTKIGYAAFESSASYVCCFCTNNDII